MKYCMKKENKFKTRKIRKNEKWKSFGTDFFLEIVGSLKLMLG